jgi:hypothetical protein
MHGRLERRLEKAGLASADRDRVLEANAHALLHRAQVLGDEEHFETLHPSRTALVLLDDCDVTDVDVLEAATSVESEHDMLRVAPAGALGSAVPTPRSSGDALLEDLIVAEAPVQLIALAERLDHARHLHLRPEADWDGFHASVGAVYLPVAQRAHARLARRYDWWWQMFERRFLPGRKPG